MNCEELLEQLGEYLDQEAREEICRQIETHLKSCHGCRIEVDKTRKTIMLYQADRAIDMPPAISISLQEALAREYSRKGPMSD